MTIAVEILITLFFSQSLNSSKIPNDGCASSAKTALTGPKGRLPAPMLNQQQQQQQQQKSAPPRANMPAIVNNYTSNGAGNNSNMSNNNINKKNNNNKPMFNKAHAPAGPIAVKSKNPSTAGT